MKRELSLKAKFMIIPVNLFILNITYGHELRAAAEMSFLSGGYRLTLRDRVRNF